MNYMGFESDSAARRKPRRLESMMGAGLGAQQSETQWLSLERYGLHDALLAGEGSIVVDGAPLEPARA